MKAENENTTSSRRPSLQTLENKLDSLYKLVEQIWLALQEEGDSDAVSDASDASTELLE